MKRLIFCFFLLGGMLFSLPAQVIFSETFDFVGGPLPHPLPLGWTTVSLFENDPTPGDALWTPVALGYASFGNYWNNRRPINSPTWVTGAIAFDSDYLDSGLPPGGICQGSACAPHSSALISPLYDLSTYPNVGLKFHQYLHTDSAVTKVGISNDGGTSWTDIEINQEITHKPFGGESNRADSISLDISQWAGNEATVQIRFVFEGSYFFWIIDDFTLYRNGGLDVMLEGVEWPKPQFACLLTDQEAIRVKVRNIGTTPIDTIPISYDIQGGGTTLDTIFQLLAPNESLTYTFQDSADLRPGNVDINVSFDIPLAGIDVQSLNNQLDLNLPRCPLDTDTLGGEFIQEELIVEFVPGTPEATKANIRNKFAVNLKESCGCDDLELWQYTLPINLPGGPLISPNEVATRVEDEIEVNDTGFNYRMNRNTPDTTHLPPKWSFNGEAGSKCDVTIGLIDTGLDFDHNDLSGIQHKNLNEIIPNPYSPDDDNNCFDYDHWGNHFLSTEKVPYDDHSHGTHIAGLIYNDLPDSIKPAIMPLKVQTENGVGTLFHTVCAMYYAAFEGADILNMSLGYAGVKSDIMDSAFYHIGQDYNILVVTSTGNDGYLLDSIFHWPSDFSLTYPQVISVAAADDQGNLASFSNYSATKVDIAAPGVDMYSPVPGNGFGYKSGTSMSAGIITRAAAIYLCNAAEAIGGDSLKTILLDSAESKPALDSVVAGGKFLGLINSSISNEKLLPPYPIEVFPNPFGTQLTLEIGATEVEKVSWHILDINGRIIQADAPLLYPGLNRITIETGNWAKGIYLIQVRSERGFFTKKLIKH